MPKQQDEDDDGNGDAEKPEQDAAGHGSLLWALGSSRSGKQQSRRSKVPVGCREHIVGLANLAGRLFAVVVHGDVEGAENVRRSIADWLRFMKLAPAGPTAELDRYIGYWQPYATSHEELDATRPYRKKCATPRARSQRRSST